jgi:hypothetical protein
MSSVAILGAGPIGATLAHTLAARERVREVRLIDDRGRRGGEGARHHGSRALSRTTPRLSRPPATCPRRPARPSSSSPTRRPRPSMPARRGWRSCGSSSRSASPRRWCLPAPSQRELMARAIAELHVPEARVVGPPRWRSSRRCAHWRAWPWTGRAWKCRCAWWVCRRSGRWWRGKKRRRSASRSRRSCRRTRSPRSARASPASGPRGPTASAPPPPASSKRSRSGRAAAIRVSCRSAAAASPPCRPNSTPGASEGILEPSLTRQERTMLDNAIV